MSIASPIAAPTRTLSFNRAIFHAALSVGAAGIFVKVLATFKEIAVASVYGRSDAMDAFLAAALIPSIPTRRSISRIINPWLLSRKIAGGLGCASLNVIDRPFDLRNF
jgi:hypothetical protein